MRSLLLLALVASGSVLAQSDPSAEAPDRLVERARKLLAERGYPVPETIRAEERDDREVIADMEAQQSLFMPDDAFEAQFHLLRGFGVKVPPSPRALRQQTIAGMAGSLSAYYDPLRKSFVMLPARTRAMAEGLAGSALPLVVHELVHAHQDARDGGLAAVFGTEPRTLDAALAARCVVEGEAELVSVLCFGGEDALQKSIGHEAVGDMEKLMTDEMTGTIYDVGRRFAAARHVDGGIEAVRAAAGSPPRSTEQVLHPQKHGADLPTAVTLPEIDGLQRTCETTFGELMIAHLLRQLGNDVLSSRLAAAGWDGDRFCVYAGEGSTRALAWRTVWDRDEDASEFAARLEASERGAAVRDGRIVDWFGGPDGALRDAVAVAFAESRATAAGEPVEADAESTAAAEQVLRERLRQDSTEAGVWRHEKAGIAVPIPDGWEVREVNGVRILLDRATAETGFAHNVNVLVLPLPRNPGLERLRNLNRSQLERMKLEILRLEVVEHDGRDVLLGEYRGAPGGQPPMHFLMLLWPDGDRQVVVTATASQEGWAAAEKDLRAIMAGIRLRQD